jgi:hypothetical protein
MSMYAVFCVARDIPPVRSAVLAAHDDQLDPELIALPDPPRPHRTLTLVVLVLAAAAAMAMTFVLRQDITYALTSRTPAELGDLRSADARELQLRDNRLVRAEAILGPEGGIRYERLLSSDTFHAVPVAGRPDIWVVLRVPARGESARWEPPRQFAGRLVRFDSAGPRQRGLASTIERATHEPSAAAAWLLLDGETPADERWALVLAMALLGFAAWHIAATARMIRKVPV